MKRPLRPEEVSLWAVVTATVRPASGRVRAPTATPTVASAAVQAQPATKPPPGKMVKVKKAALTPPPPKPAPPPPPPSEAQSIEPGRRRRIARGRDEIYARLDLHGLDQDLSLIHI